MVSIVRDRVTGGPIHNRRRVANIPCRACPHRRDCLAARAIPAGLPLREPVFNVIQSTAQQAIPLAPSASARVPRAEIAVQSLTGTDDFARLAQHWNRLHHETATASV